MNPTNYINTKQFDIQPLSQHTHIDRESNARARARTHTHTHTHTHTLSPSVLSLIHI